MKKYIITLVYMLVSLSLTAQTGQSSGAPANVAAVDLGLPSGTRWANMNVGASSPEEYGGYYAWGETDEKDVYNWSTYIHCDGTNETCHDIGDEIAGTQYDVAHVKWGKGWQMPTIDQIKELIDNCSVTRVTVNGVDGNQFTGPSGNSIFLPAAGSCWDSSCHNTGFIGLFWSSTLNQSPSSPGDTYCFEVGAGGASYNGGYGRYFGHSVRPVLRATSSVPRTFIDLGLPSGTKWANMNVGASRPEEYGKYFAWGETLEKGSYTWDNYICPEATCGKSGDPVFDLVGDKADIAGTKLDAATMSWGPSWSMPTAKQIEELASNCYSSLATINGVQCRVLKSRINGNEITLPLAGARWFEDFAYEGSLGYYWSSTLRQGGYVSPCRLIVRDDAHGWGWSMGGENDRFSAFPIRPVYVENAITGDTLTLHKFSVAFDDSGSSELLGSEITFQRNGNDDSYSLSTGGQQEYDPYFDISKVSSVTRKSFGKLSLPETSGLSKDDLTVTVDGDTISTDEKGAYDGVGSTLVATNKDGEIVYMNIASVEDANSVVGADLNAKESAITLMLPLVPNIFVAFDDEQLPHLKEMIWDVEEVKQLAAAIDRSVTKYGYTDFGEISKEATAARNRISQLLHLDKLAERTAGAIAMTSRKSMLKESGSTESPYIVNTHGYPGLQVEITDSDEKIFYYPHSISGYNCEVTAYNINRFAYSSLVKGKYDAETNTYYIPDLGDDYDYYKNILKPQKVSTFMNTFTSFKYDDLERLGQFLEESADFIQGDIGFDDMHWDDMKKTAYFDINAQDDAIVLLFPRGNEYMLGYNVLMSIVKPVVKIISKKAAKMFDSDVFVPFICGQMMGDPNYALELSSVLNDPDLSASERIEKITSVSWNKFFKEINNLAWDKLDEGIKDALTDLIDESVLKAGSIQAASDWVSFKATFKMLNWIKKYGDIITGFLGTFFEDNAVYPVHLEANGQFVLDKDAVTLGEGESVKVRILVGSGLYSCESSDETVATAKGSYDKVEITGVDAGTATITVRDRTAQKDAKINVQVTGIQTFALATSTVSVPVFEDRSVTIERGDGPFHIYGGDEKIAVAKLGGGNPMVFPGEKYAVVVSGVSEGTTTYNVYNEATDQTLQLTVDVTAEKVAITDGRVVDLGLSVNWANCNVGASEPEESGEYFAWGEVEPKDYYGLNNYQYYSNGSFVDIGGDISGTQYDAATHNMGNGWRMPTKAEYEELISKCEWKFVTYRRERGWKVTGPSGNSIFLPATGYILNDWNENVSIDGFYWSSNITSNNREVHTLFTSMDEYKMYFNYMNRFEGRTIRAVTGTGYEDPVIPSEAVDLGLISGLKWAPFNLGANKPEEVGNLYSWGELRYRKDQDLTLNPLCEGTSQYVGNDMSGTQYDIAHMKWGGNWRMPTVEEIQELADRSHGRSIEACEENGVHGWRFNGDHNNIFIPFAECVEDNGYDATGSLWTSTIDSLDNTKAYALNLDYSEWHIGGFIISNSDYLYITSEKHDSCFCVRPVYCPYMVSPLIMDFGTVPMDSVKEEKLLIRNTSDRIQTFGIKLDQRYSFDSENINYFKLNDDSLFTLLPGEEKLLSVLCYGLPYKKSRSCQITIEANSVKRFVTLQGYGGEKWYGTNAYSVLNLNDSCLTIFYDDKRDYWESQGMLTFDLIIDSSKKEYIDRGDINYAYYADSKKIVFDSSFANARPTTTYEWFYRLPIKEIEGLQYINTSNVTDMTRMFAESSATNLDLRGLNTSNVRDMSEMFYNCSSLTNINLSGFNTSNVENMSGMFYNCSSLTSLDLSSFNTSKVENMNSMFYLCIYVNRTSSLVSLDLRNFNTSKVMDMEYMFRGATSLTNLDLSSFNTSNVTNMRGMFENCSSLTNLDLGSFDTSNVTKMNSMFDDCSSLTNLNLGNFNTSNVTTMRWMFLNCSSLTNLDLGSFNTLKVVDTGYMFKGATSLINLDLGSFNTSNVTDMGNMFNRCSALRTVYVGSQWATDNVEKSDKMFTDCINIMGGMGTTYNADHVDKEYARIDGGATNPGYLTSKKYQ